MQISQCDTDKSVFIIAEIGNNHEGDFSLAMEMVGRAAEAGADAVKFQTFRTEHYVSKADRARFDRLKSFELSFEQFAALKQEADRLEVVFLSTPFDIASAQFLAPLVPAFKIASGDNTFYPLLETVAEYGKPVLLSTGLARMEQVHFAKALVENIWARNGASAQIAVLHCVSSYPTPANEANLGAIQTLAAELGCTVGYSDHTLGVQAAVLSVGLGARVVEKHFTIDKNHSDFRDHQLSADPKDMKDLVERIREAEALIGNGRKEPQPSEQNALPMMRRSIVAVRDMAAGETVRLQDITWVRPADGLAPGLEKHVLGKTLQRDVAQGTPLQPEAMA